MRVLMVAPQPFFEPRGTPISVYQRLQGLSSLDYDVDLVTYHIGSGVEIPKINIHRSPRIPFINKVKIGPSLAKIPLDIMLFFQTLWMLLTRRYDVIHSHEEAAFFVVVLAWLFRLPHIYDMHSSLSKQFAASSFGHLKPVVWLFEKLENWVLREADVVLTIGSDLEDYVLYINRQANHIRIENIAVQKDEAQAATSEIGQELRQQLGLQNKTAIVYTGTFERYQGLDMLFASAQDVVAQYPDAVFVMVGGKPEQVAACQQKAIQAGLAENVIFTGIVSLDDSLHYLEMADILVSPRTEGLSVPLKIYSYLHSGKPMVATNIFAHTQILDEDTAVLTEPNATAYTEGLLRLIEDPALRQQIGSQACAYAAKEFSREGYLSKLEKAYLAIKFSMRISDIQLTDLAGASTTSLTAGSS